MMVKRRRHKNHSDDVVLTQQDLGVGKQAADRQDARGWYIATLLMLLPLLSAYVVYLHLERHKTERAISHLTIGQETLRRDRDLFASRASDLKGKLVELKQQTSASVSQGRNDLQPPFQKPTSNKFPSNNHHSEEQQATIDVLTKRIAKRDTLILELRAENTHLQIQMTELVDDFARNQAELTSVAEEKL